MATAISRAAPASTAVATVPAAPPLAVPPPATTVSSSQAPAQTKVAQTRGEPVPIPTAKGDVPAAPKPPNKSAAAPGPAAAPTSAPSTAPAAASQQPVAVPVVVVPIPALAPPVPTPASGPPAQAASALVAREEPKVAAMPRAQETTPPSEDKEAFAFYRARALAGDAEARFQTGDMYDKGRGVVQSSFQAYIWFGLSACSGHAGARARQAQAALRLQPTERQQADRQVDSIGKGCK